MRFRMWGLMGIIAALSGCSVGIKPDHSSPSMRFVAPVNYQEAFRRADNYARTCHTSRSFMRGSFDVTGNLYTDNQTGVVHITAGRIGTDLERIDIAAEGQQQAKVTVTVWGTGIWDDSEIEAVKYSVQTGTPICH